MEEQAISGQSGLPGSEQWLSFRQKSGAERTDKISSVLGSGALHLIRTRSGIRKELKRHTNQSKGAENFGANETGSGGSNGAGGLGKWLREHLGGSRGSHEVNGTSVKRTGNGQVESVNFGSDKSTPRLTYASQNLYCSLPRENGRVFQEDRSNSRRANVAQGTNRPRSNSANFHPKTPSFSKSSKATPTPTTTTLTDSVQMLRRGGPVYSSDGKSMRRRNRDRRRHSLNEVQDDRGFHQKRSIPDGGDVGPTMTDLHPSPPGYRGQDEAPGPARAPSTFSYTRNNHVANEQTTFKNQNSYATDDYQSSSHRSQGDYYHVHKTDSVRVDTNNTKKTSSHSAYPDGYKKNAPGYKNDSGYSESLGFGSYSLPLGERDEASPPPTPPVRDASSLKGVCYGPGHEKYPSWPSAPEHDHPEEEIHGSSAHGGSHRSKSWTDHTSYPKEKPAQYTRPHTKRPNPAFTQQLKTVMERCEKIPAETYEARNRNGNETADPSRLWPRVDREGKSLGDAEYVAPSPPEREQPSPQTLSHADLEAYVRSYQDPRVSEVDDLYQESSLTQAGLEEYARVQHSQQASYAQSEGYHSYVSSVDSTTNTPFLDRLRRDSEAVAQRPTSSWDDSREGRDSVVTTSSGSASSSETLKWHGSMSDVSVTSGLPARQGGPDKWHHGSMSDVSTASGLPQKQTSSRDKWQGSLSDVSSSEMSPSKNRHQLDKWQNSMNERNKRDRASLPGNSMPRGSTIEQQSRSSRRENEWQESSIDDDRPSERQQNDHQWERANESDLDEYSLPQTVPRSPTYARTGHLTSPRSPDSWNPRHGSMSDLSTNGVQSSKQLIAHSARVQTPQRHHSESVLYMDRERSQRKLYPGNSQSQDINQQRMPATSPQQSQLSVAERISELEKQQQQQMRYTYLDPEKRHRVSDPTLKAIQKKALLSFYERHHQASWRSEPQLTQGATPAPQSPPPQPPPRPRPVSSRRASSASDYASGIWREKSTRSGANVTELSTPKHQHSNSCGSLSTDLLGPVIVGPAISIDDWVPERPPKKPHLRNVYNDRVPSPDLPPPSPPTVTEHEVLNCDDPLPPPPPDLGDNYPQTIVNDEEKRRGEPERHKAQPERQSTRRSKHAQKRDLDKQQQQQQRKASPIESSPSNAQRFVRATPSKQIDSELILENGFANHRMAPTGRSSLRYPSTKNIVANGRSGPVHRVSEERLFPPRAPAQLPDLISQRYTNSGNQRPAPQVPVEPRIIRQESMRVESTRVDASGLLRNDSHRLETSSGQRPQPQVAKSETKPTRPNFLPLHDVEKASKYPENSHNFTIGSPIKTSYEASSKLFAEGSPQKYHEPPKYVPNSQRHSENGQTRNYYALPPKYQDAPVQMPQSQIPMDRYAAGSPSSPPPPLAPRQNTPGRKSLPPPPRPAPPRSQQGSQSKASYLAYRRERGAPDSEGSYKRTMSPTARLDDWPPLRDRDDPVLLRVTPRHPHPLRHQELPKSHSVDALHQRLEDRTAHSVEVIGKLSYDLSKKLQASEVRSSRGENNNNLESNHHCQDERKERISPQSIHVLNDRNRQLERERRKLAASCEPPTTPPSIESHRRTRDRDVISTPEEFQGQRSATIEMTSRNVELLNRRNAVHESPSQREVRGQPEPISIPEPRPPPVIEKPPPPTTSPPRTPESDRRRHRSTGSGPGGAVPRRTGSYSSSTTSTSPKTVEGKSCSLPRNSSSPKSNHRASPDDSTTVNGEIFNCERVNITSRRKISSPTQTDETGANEGTISTSSVDQSTLNFTRASQTSTTIERHLPRSPISSSSSSSSPSSPTSPSIEENTRTSPCVSPQPGIEGLTLVQRTEVVLRVNAPTSDAASQTEIVNEELVEKISRLEIPPEPRKKLPEEIECEELSRDLASQLSPDDKLLTILVPAPEHKKPTDYVTGLFRVEATLQPRPKRPISLEEPPTSPASTSVNSDDIKGETSPSIPSTPVTPTTTDVISPLSPTSAYFTTSEGKARFLARYSRDVAEETTPTTASVDADGTSVATPMTSTDNQDLKQKKEELVLRLDRKLVVLRAEQEAVQEEGVVNDALGARVTSRVTAIARPPEASKYRLHVEEVGKITSLLLGLSGRLARAENALYGMPPDHAERKILESKRDKLLDQLEEAKVLKSNIDKRSVNVSAILSKYLNDEEYADYQHFINMKAKLIMDGREIQDKVKLGEEQLAALKEAID